MDNDKRTPEEILSRLVKHGDVTSLSYPELVDDFRSMPNLEEFKPSGICRVDPRNGDRVIYTPMRSKRPTELKSKHLEMLVEPICCPVCNGETTDIIDVAPLSKGFTFINKNMFPVVSFDFPGDSQPKTYEPSIEKHRILGTYAQGGHWLQWISTEHDADFHNMPIGDITTVLRRLATFEGHLMMARSSNMPNWTDLKGLKHTGFVGIIRNYGQLGGATLAHGHMQITHTNVIPRAILDDRDFYAKYGKTFAAFMLEENPPYLTVRDFGNTVRLVVPYFMKRPHSAILLFKDTRICALHQLSENCLADLAAAMSFVTSGVRHILEDLLERSFAYNMIFHNGPTGSLYIEILPNSQEWGGYEHMGWFICQGTPVTSADAYKAIAE